MNYLLKNKAYCRMDERFALPLTYKGEELFFPARRLYLGYVPTFEVAVYSTPIHFEWDEERNIRARVHPALMEDCPENLLSALNLSLL